VGLCYRLIRMCSGELRGPQVVPWGSPSPVPEHPEPQVGAPEPPLRQPASKAAASLPHSKALRATDD
jgi:hypothetical protein